MKALFFFGICIGLLSSGCTFLSLPEGAVYTAGEALKKSDLKLLRTALREKVLERFGTEQGMKELQDRARQYTDHLVSRIEFLSSKTVWNRSTRLYERTIAYLLTVTGKKDGFYQTIWKATVPCLHIQDHVGRNQKPVVCQISKLQ